MLNRIISVGLIIASAVLAIALFRHRSGQKSGGPRVQPPVMLLEAGTAADLALLDRRIAQVRLDDVPLDQAIRILSEQVQVNLCADWPAMTSAGVPRNFRIHLYLDHVTLRQTISALDQFVTNGPWRIHGLVRDGVVTITTEDRLETRTECFNIRPIINGLRVRYGAFQRVPNDSLSTPSSRAIEEKTSNAEIVESIVKCITDIVSPESWRDAGGTVGSIREVGGIVVIAETPENLAAVADLLHQIHRSICTNDFPPLVQATAPPTQSGAIATSGLPSTQPITQFINLQGLIEKLHAENARLATNSTDHRLEKTRDEVMEDIRQLLTDTIEAESWQEYGGKLGRVRWFGPVMGITQTPANLRAVRLMLDDLYHATSSKDFISATRRSAATTRDSGIK
jgi:hypothetical protein